MKKAINEAIKKGLRNLYRPESQKLSPYAEDHFYLSPESSSIVGKWESIGYQVGIMNMMSNDEIEIFTWQKSARTGYTKIIVAFVHYLIEHKGRNVALYQPTDDDRDEFCKDEIDPSLRDCPATKKIFPWFGVKHKNNTLKKKKFVGSTLHLLGGTSPRNYRRITVDVVIYDELAAFLASIGGEGSPTELGDTRFETSNFPKSIRGSSPKIAGTCQIEASLADADVVLLYHLPCPHCEVMQPLEWGGKDCEHGFIWDDEKPETVEYCCKHCTKTFDYSHLAELLELGQWRSANGETIYDHEADAFKNAQGKIIETPSHVGIKLWSAYSVFYTWEKLIRGFLKATKASKAGDNSKLITFINTKLGETWEEDAGSKIDDDALYKRREAYPTKDGKIIAPNRVLYTTIGIDCQDDRFEWEIIGWGKNEESWSLGYEVLSGDLGQPILWTALAEMLNKPIHREDGTILNVGRICMDSGGHFTQEVYNFSKKMGLFFLVPVKGSSSYGNPIADFPRKKNKHKVYLTQVDTNAAKELIYQRLLIQTDNLDESTPGFCHFPIAESHNDTYFKMLLAENKVLRFSKGQRIYAYECPKGRRNEALDCRVYALAALRISQSRHGLDLNKLAEEAKTKTNSNGSKTKKGFADLASKF